ncbi:tail fiber domain-containing protein [Chitinophaga nivalis]|uniref:Tail fiber domain-containing protein n=1 Tax=Chitinophaga nivalis TaxID=2991709 RepID=A0ABT3IPB9_9BACT|nr:tail fiber domain-containing protein [Chitinophaga nivalis]MCW3464573.1 tail fiber domain-containing protein [Chitinophaga nivalis]MCW3485736.1 tail fiber domain-containing protein [Chitinophaga nivalis]
MSITTRDALKGRFKSGAIPTPQDFINLIDSALVRRDDAFFGKWQSGTCYYEGDVVLYNNALYSCVPDQQHPCGCEGESSTAGKGTDPGGPVGHCSVDNPEKDKDNWIMLDIDATDEDWEIIRDAAEVPVIMYAKVFGKIGMGTQDPAARVHIQDDNLNAGFLFSPDGANDPEFVIERNGEGQRRDFSQTVTNSKVRFTTNTEGFLFNAQFDPTRQENEKDKGESVRSRQVFITTPYSGPAIGIGTTLPQAALDIQTRSGSHLALNPVGAVTPQAVWLYKGEDSPVTGLVTELDSEAVKFTTNAPEGFYFRKLLDNAKNYLKKADTANGVTLVAIKPEGRVGIGTESPVTDVEITRTGGAGAFQMCLDNTNPAFSIINNRPNAEDLRNYLTLGADNDTSIFITDASKGFVFRRGKEYGNGNEREVNQGDDLITITAAGKTTIGGLSDKGYDLQVKGKMRAFGLYLDTDVKKIKEHATLDSVLDKVKNLNPVSFTFNKKANVPEGEKQIGFLPHQVQEYFPELVNTDEDGTKTLAYANLVAVLTKAIQEQQVQISTLESRLAQLEGSKDA